MLQDLEFEYVGDELSATIDNETQKIQVYKIVKAPTHFILYDTIDTALNTAINVNLFLGYGEESEIEEDEYDISPINKEDTDKITPIEKGFVKLKITSVSGQMIYYEEVINFTNGHINTKINNNLNIGTYLLQVDYLGNKYYEPTSLTIQFNINRREIKCIFENENIEAYPNQNISIDLTLVDSLNNKKISNCLLYYYFNGIKYLTQTDNNGHAILNVTMPEIDSLICPMNIIQEIYNDNIISDVDDNVFYFDDDGRIKYLANKTEFILDSNTEQNNENIEISVVDYNDTNNEEEKEVEYNLVPKYTLEIEIDSTIYKLESKEYIDIFIKKYATDIQYTITNNDSIIYIEGDVIAYNDNNETSNVQYGLISYDVAEIEPHPQSTITLNDVGHFSFEKEIIQTGNANESPKTYSYSPVQTTKTILNIVGDSNKITRNYAKQHKIGFIAKTTSNNNPVSYGMMTFIITQNSNEIYKYVTEMNINGEASFYFDVSTVGKYKIKAIYHSIFEYQGSESNIMNYEII